MGFRWWFFPCVILVYKKMGSAAMNPFGIGGTLSDNAMPPGSRLRFLPAT
jgi:hypothetical protein